MKTVIVHGKKISRDGDWRSPRHGREECALWTVTRAIPRFWKGKLYDWTEHFDIHPLTKSEQFEGIPTRRPDAWKWYCEQDGSRPIWLQAPEAHHPDDQERALRLFNQVPGAKRFPMREIQEAFPMKAGTYPNIVEEPNRYFVEMTGAIIAKAIYDGFQCIILNGIGTMNAWTFSHLEHQVTHRSILYWMAYARALGITVLVEGTSYLHTPQHIYAYERFNYEELSQARVVQAQIQRREEWQDKENVNRAQRRRGRPSKFKVPDGVFGEPQE